MGYGYWGKIVKKYIENNTSLALVRIFNRDITPFNNKECLQDLDAVFICLPSKLHYEYSKFFLLNGINVFCEKPLTLSFDESRELIEIARDRKLILYTDFPFVFSPSINYIKSQFNKLGEKKYLRFNFEQFGLFYPGEDVFDTIASHPLSVIGHLFGPDQLSFNIEKVNVIQEDKDGAAVAAEIKFNHFNVQGLLFVSLISPLKRRNCTIYGEKGQAIYEMTEDVTARIIRFDLTEKKSICHEFSMSFNEKNNLQYSIKKFVDILESKSTENIDLSLFVASGIKKIKDSCYGKTR